MSLHRKYSATFMSTSALTSESMSNQWFVRTETSQQMHSKNFDETGSLYQSKASQKSPFLAAGSATQSTLGNTSNLKGKLQSLEVSPPTHLVL